MEIAPFEIRHYKTRSGRLPIREWLGSLDGHHRGIVASRLTRVRRGLFGDCEPVGGGVFELRFDVGPGLRVYFGRDGGVVVLLHAGDKSGQAADILAARGFWKDYLWRTGR